MKKIVAGLVLMFAVAGVSAQSIDTREVVVNWTPPVPMMSDGTQGTPDRQIDGYRIEYTTSDGVVTEVTTQGYASDSIVLPSIPVGVFQARAKSWCGGCNAYSDWSEMVVADIQIAPVPSSPNGPQGITVTVTVVIN